MQREIVKIDDDKLEPDYDMKYRMSLDDNVTIEKLVKYLITLVRSSFEYRLLIENFKTKLDIDTCVYYSGYSIKNGLSIEFHHTVFKLRNIVETVLRKQLINNDGYVYEHEIVKEVVQLHYQFKVGLTPLNPTAHQLADLGKLKIHPDLIIGSWRDFYNEYKEYMSDDVLETYDNYLDECATNDLSKYPELLKRKSIHIEASNKNLLNESMLNNMLVSDKLKQINNDDINNLLNKKE